MATSLLSIAILLAGAVGYYCLPVAALPQVDFPTIMIFGKFPGASPETMASSVATPPITIFPNQSHPAGKASQGDCICYNRLSVRRPD